MLIVDNVVFDQRSEHILQELAISRGADVAAKELRPEKVSAEIFLQRCGSVDFLLQRPAHELQQVVLLPALLSKTEEAHCQLLDALGILVCKSLLPEASEKSGHVLGLGLEDEEELLVVFKFSPRILVEGFEVKRIRGRDIFAAEQGTNVAAVVLLVLHNLIQCDLVLDK